MTSDFKSQYQHPLWQKRRLEMFQAAGYRCAKCMDDQTQLHLHHKHYVRGRKVWEYDDHELQVLCEPCHGDAHAIKDEALAMTAHLSMDEWSDIADLLYGFCRGVYDRENAQPPREWGVTAHIGFLASRLYIGDYEIVSGVTEIVRAHRMGGVMPGESEIFKKGDAALKDWADRIALIQAERDARKG